MTVHPCMSSERAFVQGQLLLKAGGTVQGERNGKLVDSSPSSAADTP